MIKTLSEKRQPISILTLSVIWFSNASHYFKKDIIMSISNGFWARARKKPRTANKMCDKCEPIGVLRMVNEVKCHPFFLHQLVNVWEACWFWMTGARIECVWYGLWSLISYSHFVRELNRRHANWVNRARVEKPVNINRNVDRE